MAFYENKAPTITTITNPQKRPFKVTFFRQKTLCFHAYVSIFAGIFSIYTHVIEAKRFSSKNKNDEEYSEEETSTTEPGVDPWAHLELPVNIWIIIVGSVIAFWFFLSCCLATCCGPRNIECHLCEEPIRKRKWTKSGHWDQCAQDHARFLNELPDTEYPCPSCHRPLKQWPKKLGGKVFKCQVGLECNPHPRLDSPTDSTDRMYNADKKPVDKPRRFVDVANNGESRLVCFEDGIDVCKPCAIEHWGPQRTTTTNTASTFNTHNTHQNSSYPPSHESTRSSTGSKKILNGGWVDVQLRTISHQVHDMDRMENGAIPKHSLNVNGKVIVVQNDEQQ